MMNLTLGQIKDYMLLFASIAVAFNQIKSFFSSNFGHRTMKIIELEKNVELLKASNLAIVRSQITSKCEQYQEKGFLPEYARYCLSELYKNYKALGGNHGVEAQVTETFKLPSKPKKEGK